MGFLMTASCEFESVRVDLADSEFVMGLPLIVWAPLGQFSDVAEKMVEVSGILEVENPLPVVEFCSSNDRDCSSPLCCSPLAVIDPADCPISIVVDIGMSQGQTSQWVKKQYCGFCRLVGFPTGSHKQQCLDLLQRIEAERFKHKSSNRMKQSAGSVRKGSRELHNLVSTINYDGHPNDC